MHLSTEEERWDYILRLDDELLVGGVTLSEWSTFIVREADIAFAKGAFLASILTAFAAAETHLRSEYGDHQRRSAYAIIENAPIDSELKAELHTVRAFRNQWVHVQDPNSDLDIQVHPERYVSEIRNMAANSIRVLRQTIYEKQWL